MSGIIPLTRGLVSLVDDDMVDLLSVWRWHATNSNNKWVYACRRVLASEREPLRHILMHRLIIGACNGQGVDHINGDRLDNRRINLRLCTTAQNARNRGKTRLNTSGFKGVSYNPKLRGPWVAQIMVDGKSFYLGHFTTSEEAAAAYKAAAEQYHGVFANTGEARNA